MKLNRVLGDIVHGPAVMNEWSYIFCLFGEPSIERTRGAGSCSAITWC